jgi:hypothetical protein
LFFQFDSQTFFLGYLVLIEVQLILISYEMIRLKQLRGIEMEKDIKHGDVP